MRITNKIIQNNSLTNVNNNKLLQDKLSTQISTGKKVARPSDDPIVALRSLRLRTSVSQTQQYVEKNVEDAKSWLKVTEDSIKTLSDIITSIRQQYTKGTSDTLTSSDRKIILNELQALAQEVYNTGNADFAGRYVFSGYRTNTTLTYQKAEQKDYTIFEDQNTAKLDTTTYVHTDADEQSVYQTEITRIRLSYDDLGTTAPTITINGNAVTCDVMSSSGATNPYETVYNDPDKVVFVPETGEILVGANVGTTESITDFEVSYEKSNWNKGDLRPEHYFKCLDHTDAANPIEYNYNSTTEAEIEYNIGVNQAIRINTNASDCFTHDVVRDITDAINALSEVEEIESAIERLQTEYNAIGETNVVAREAKQAEIDAAKKAQTYIKEKLHKLMSDGIANADNYLDKNNVALTTCGTRSKRLELIENRLDTQLSTLTELKSENEDADLAETAIKLSSANYAYDAALMATSKILQQNLLNYI